MNLRAYAKTAERLITNHSTEILTAVGVIGTVATGILATKATVKAVDVLEQENLRGEDTPKKEIVKATWKLYIPPISVAAVTCTAIVLSNRISAKRLTALGAAYTLADKAHTEYEAKVKEMFGENKEQKVKDGVAQDLLNANPYSNAYVHNANGGNVMFYDAWTGRYFTSDKQTVMDAVNHVNHSIVKGDYASLNELYSWLAIPTVPSADAVGWNGDTGLIEPMFSTGTTEDGNIPVHVISFRTEPRRRYDKVYS